MANSGNPELQRLLATLNSYAPRAQPTTTGTAWQQQEGFSGQTSQTNLLSLTSRKRPHESSSQWPLPGTPAIPGLGMLPTPVPAQAPAPPVITSTTATATATATNPSPSPSSSSTNLLRPRSTPGIPSSAPPTIPDASCITTYPAALKHVTKHLAASDTIRTRIRHLISTQHQHEQQWHAGREALVALHESRRSTSAQVSALLRSLGGKDTTATATTAATSSGSSNNDKTNQAELTAYDAKVYRSLVAMQADFDRQLRNLGVPFFAISHDLVLRDGERIGSETESEPGSGSGQKIDKGELRELQKRMLALLEDLFAD